MASPSTSIFPMTGDPIVDVITNGTEWILGNNRTVNWSISDGFNNEVWIDPAFAASHVAAALSTFSQFANIKFSYSGYFIDPLAAFNGGSDVNVSLDGANLFFNSSSVWAIGHFPTTAPTFGYTEAQAGDIFLNINSDAANLPSYEPGSQGFFLILHELGHALGLKHLHDDGDTGRPTAVSIGLGDFDTDVYSIMSYQDKSLSNVNVDPATPMILDVIGIQFLYGINRKTNAKNNDHRLTDSFTYQTIWDAGGVDRINVAATGLGWYIELPDTILTPLVPEKWGIAVPLVDVFAPFPATLYWLEGDIENVKGSGFEDVIHGNRFANVVEAGSGADLVSGKRGHDLLKGQRGDDTLRGDAGNDTLAGGPNSDRIVGGGGGDLLRGDGGGDNLNGGGGADTLVGGGGSDNLFAGAGADVINGFAGADTLKGGGGNDTLNGGKGPDVLFGGKGSDLFVYGDRSGSDQIRDYAPGQDRVDLTDFGFASRQEAKSFAEVVNGKVVFDFGGGDVLTISGSNPLSISDIDLIV